MKMESCGILQKKLYRLFLSIVAFTMKDCILPSKEEITYTVKPGYIKVHGIYEVLGYTRSS